MCFATCMNIATICQAQSVLADLTSCSRALQYALKHPLVVPDTGALLHSPGYTRDYLKRKVSIVPLNPHVLALFPGLSHVCTASSKGLGGG